MDRYENLHRFSRPESLNDFSFWFPKIEGSGIPVPKSAVVHVPRDMDETFYMENPDEDMVRIAKFVEEKVKPAIKEAGIHAPLFIKNARFSGKFDANRCCLCQDYQLHLADHIARIMFDDLCNDIGGGSEVVIRERIGYDPVHVPCIYNGLPFRPEFRVFYDFDLKKVLFTANYWDYDYCYPHLYELTDRIIFNTMREQLEDTFIGYKEFIEEAVANAMKDVEGLEGPWSVDIMMKNYPSNDSCDLDNPCTVYGDGEPEIYLIDMATAESSAYWDRRPK